MQCTHSNQLADVGMLQKNKAKAKRYGEENITIMSMIISSSHSYIYLPQVLHNSRVFLLQTETDRQTDRHREGGGVGADRQTDRQTERQADRCLHTCLCVQECSPYSHLY